MMEGLEWTGAPIKRQRPPRKQLCLRLPIPGGK